MPLPINTSEGFRWLETPDPNRMSLEICIASTNLRQASDFPVVGTTRYDQWRLGQRIMASANLAGPYIYAAPSPDQRPEGYNKFIFAPVIDNTAAATAFQTFYGKRSKSWPPVLASILLKGSGAGTRECVGAASGITYTYGIPGDIPAIDVGWTRDGYDGPTVFKTEIFLSNSPFDLSAATVVDAPRPRSIHFDMHVVSASIPPCLHIVVRTPLTEVGISSPTSLTTYAEKVFAATTTTNWANYVEFEDQEFVNGIWKRTKITVIAPT